MIGVTSSGDRPAVSLPNKCREKGVAHPPFFLNLSESPSRKQVAIYANHQTFWVEILCGLILLSYFEVVIGII